MTNPINYREKIIKIFTLLGGVYFFFEFLLPEAFLQRSGLAAKHEDITLGFIAIGLVTFGLGIINLVMIHSSKLIFAKKGWSNSLALLVGLVVMLVSSIYDWRIDLSIQDNSKTISVLSDFLKKIADDIQNKTPEVPELRYRLDKLKDFGERTLSNELATYHYIFSNNSEIDGNRIKHLEDEFSNRIQVARAALKVLSLSDGEEAVFLKLIPLSTLTTEILLQKREMLRLASESWTSKKVYNFLFEGLFVSLGSAMFSLLGVYIAAAAYRAFRIKTFEATLMMAAAIIVILGQIPFGVWIYQDMPDIRNWLLRIPNSAVSRAIGIGASIAGLVIAFRMWFSIESRSFSKRDR